MGSSFFTVARGPSFILGADQLSTLDNARAYIGGSIQVVPQSTSLVSSAFVLPIQRNGTAEYFLFVQWFSHCDSCETGSGDKRTLSRIYVGRSVGSPVGPFYDRIGQPMNERTAEIISGSRTVHILTAVWGSNCGGRGYDVLRAVQMRCEGEITCKWNVSASELDDIASSSYASPPNGLENGVAGPALWYMPSSPAFMYSIDCCFVCPI